MCCCKVAACKFEVRVLEREKKKISLVEFISLKRSVLNTLKLRLIMFLHICLTNAVVSEIMITVSTINLATANSFSSLNLSSFFTVFYLSYVILTIKRAVYL